MQILGTRKKYTAQDSEEDKLNGLSKMASHYEKVMTVGPANFNNRF